MNLDGIDIFVKVIQTGSFTKAAKLMKRPITSVSDKVAQLEKRLGVTLILRTTRQLKLTAVGEIYYEKCVRALQEFESAEQELQVSKVGPQGRLRLTASVDVGHSVIPKLVKLYTEKYPSVKVELIVANRMVDLIAEEVDLALRVGKLSDSTYRVRKYFETTASLWATPQYLKKNGHPQTIKQIEKLSHIRFTLFEAKNIEMNRGKEKIKLAFQYQVSADDLETVKKLVLESLGIGLMPNFICEKEENAGDLIRLLPDWTWGKINLSFVYPEQKFESPNVKAFIDLALQHGY